LKAWVVQRVTAVYLALFGSYVVLYFVFSPPADHAALRGWVGQPLVGVGLLLMVVLLLSHAWVGIRDVFMDYMRPLGLRVAALSVVALVFLASGLWAVQAIILAQLA
jgi:succinate dehydrogenase / fumarate reductase membrane anchor subunit